MTSHTTSALHRLTYGLLSLSTALLVSCGSSPPPTPTAVASVVEILSSPQHGQVKVREAIIRAAADETSAELARIPFGAIVLVIARQDTWVQIESPSPRKVTGWTLMDFLDVTIAPSIVQATVPPRRASEGTPTPMARVTASPASTLLVPPTPINTVPFEPLTPTVALNIGAGAFGATLLEPPTPTETKYYYHILTLTPDEVPFNEDDATAPAAPLLEPPTPTETSTGTPAFTATVLASGALTSTATPTATATLLEPPTPTATSTGTPTLLDLPTPTETSPFEPITPTVALDIGGGASGTTLSEPPTPTETSTGTPTVTPTLLEPPTPTETAFLETATPEYEPPTPTEIPSITPTLAETPIPTNTSESPPEPEEPPGD